MASLFVSYSELLRQYRALTKPRVTQLAVFCAVIGMFLAAPGLPDLYKVGFATVGIWLLAAAAFAINCLLEQEIDARMLRTAHRATVQRSITPLQVLSLSILLGATGTFILYYFVNPLTMGLTFATFVGYAIIYTLILKPLTPQNIVIGGLSGAMPPALGWSAIANSVSAEAWILVLIIFIWTPPHFWALALYRQSDYAHAGLPMLPVTHGQPFTRLHILLYTIALSATTLLPYAIRMSGIIYLITAIVLGGMFIQRAWCLYRIYSDALARKIFHFSIIYLSVLFAALLIDHWAKILL